MVETHGGRRFAVLFFVAAFLVLLLGRWLKPVDDVALGVAAPFASALSTMASNVGSTVSGAVEGPQLRQENEALKKRIGELIHQNIVLQQKVQEDPVLRRMLHVQGLNSHMDFLAARVIGTDPNIPVQYILINRGKRDGLRDGMTVVDQSGYFVGSISDVVGNASRVLLMTSPSSSVGAMDLKTRAAGLVQGVFGSRPGFQFVPTRQTIHAGDFIITSGQMNLFPRGVLLGEIVHVTRKDVSLFQSADIQPAADFQDLEMVQVIRNFVPSVPSKQLTSP